jgi:hypothetical protein
MRQKGVWDRLLIKMLRLLIQQNIQFLLNSAAQQKNVESWE